MQEENQKFEFHRRMARVIELSIWFSVIALIVLVISAYNKYSHDNYSRYQIFLQDVDGIIVGSPVRMLGIQVGYVKNIKLVNDMVFVDLIINQKGVEIPKGSKITVESSGLGGSRSIEVYAPKQPYDSSTTQALVIQQPRRLGASVSLLYQMFKKLGDIIYRCSYFAESLNSLPKIQKIENNNSLPSKDEQQILNDVNNWLDKQNNKK